MQKKTAICRQVSPASLSDVFTGYCQKFLMGVSATIITQMGTHNGSEMVALYGTPCAIPPLSCNCNIAYLFVKTCGARQMS
jgi:hypothetical protein